MKLSTLLCAVLMAASLASADPRDWETPLAVRQGTQLQWDRSTASDAEGNVLTVWADARTGDLDVYAQMVNADGISEWAAEGIPVVTAPKGQTQPKAIAVSDGWIIIWGDYRVSDDPNHYEQDIRAQKLDRRGNILWWQNDGTGVLVETSPIPFVEARTYYLISDGSNGALVTWLGAGLHSISAQRLLTDGSVGWTTPRVIVNVDRYINVFNAAPDDFGNLLVTWVDSRNTRQQVYAGKVTAEGTMPWLANGIQIYSSLAYQIMPRIGADGLGGAVVTWSEQRDGYSSDLYAQRVSSEGQLQWSDGGVSFCNALRMQGNCSLAPSRVGGSIDGFLMVWEDWRANNSIPEIYGQKLSLQGIPMWQANGLKICGNAGSDTLNPSGSDRKEPDVLSDGAGGMVCIWGDLRNSERNIDDALDLYAGRVLNDGSMAWGETGVLVADGPHRQSRPSMQWNNGLLALYGDERSGSKSIVAQRLNLTGQRIFGDSGAVVIAGSDNSIWDPQTVALGDGRVALVWQDNRSDGEDIFCQIIAANGTIEKPVGGVRLGTMGMASMTDFALSSDGNGGFFVLYGSWMLPDSKRIYALHINSAGNVDSDPAGELVAVPNLTTDQIGPVAVADGQGGLYVAWSNYDFDYLMDAYVMRINSACHAVWNDPLRLTNTTDDDRIFGMVTLVDGSCLLGWRSGNYGDYNINDAVILPQGTLAFQQLLCDTTGNHDKAALLADPAGGAWVVWCRMDSPSNVIGISAQRLSAEGDELWAHNGVVVNSRHEYQSDLSLAHDADGNLFVLWSGMRDESSTSIFGQKLAPAGSRLWATEGLPVCAAEDNQYTPKIVSDGASGIFVAWQDYRFQQTRHRNYLFGTHLQGDGSVVNDPYWAVNGSAISDTTGPDQSYPTVCGDGAGGFLVAWANWYYYESDGFECTSLYAQRIRNITSASEPKPALAYQFELAQNYPNPFNPSTTISFSLPQSGQTRLMVYNLLGEEVTRLTDRVLPAGQYHLSFDGHTLSSGIYFYRLESPVGTLTRRMLLLK